ncbi:hypothetical protein OAP51_06380 [Alphaproteobacteria bacterium]|nr:hypothetical protein [Alphaproteobacteria bacterium]
MIEDNPTSRDGYQKRLVSRAMELTKKKHDKNIKRTELSETNSGIRFVQEYLGPVEDRLREIMHPYDIQGKGRKPKWYKWVRGLPPRLSADVALRGAVDAAAKGYTKTKTCEFIGKILVTQSVYHVVQGTTARQRLFEKYVAQKMEAKGNPYRRQDYLLFKAAELGFNSQEYLEDDGLLYRNIGSALLDAVIVATGDFILDRKYKKDGDTEQTWYVEFGPKVQNLIKSNQLKFDLMSPTFAVSAAPPVDWGLESDGGPYGDDALDMNISLVRSASPAQQEDLMKAMASGDLDTCLNALNMIQGVPYVINEYVFNAVTWVRTNEKGDDLESFPSLIMGGEVPRHLTAEEKETQDVAAYYKNRGEIMEANNLAISNGVNVSRALEEAETLIQGDVEHNTGNHFYLPHNFDKRGRVYHISDFGHHNTDYMRAMFMFANKQPVDDGNIFWLYIQIANSWGNKVDKRELEGRKQWVLENKDAIIAAGQDFKSEANFDFWSKADDPFAFLAAAHELFLVEDAKKWGNVHETGLIISLDASSSGVQHFSLSLLSEADAKKVNLYDEAPNDLYETCLLKAHEIMDADEAKHTKALRANPVTPDDIAAQNLHLLALEQIKEDLTINSTVAKKRRKAAQRRWNNTGSAQRLKAQSNLISIEQTKAHSGLNDDPSYPHNRRLYGRSVVKRNIMTFFYSSRKFGFAQQLRKDWMNKLTDDVRRGKLDEHPFGEDKGFKASTYLADVHERAVRAVVTSADEGMGFIMSVAKILAKDGIHFKFVTPLNFPVHQYYRKSEQDTQTVAGFGRKVSPKRKAIHYATYTDEINEEKSGNASSPNIIHAMDATHLMMVADRCAKYGVSDLMVVHDSFGAKIGDVGTLRRFLLEELVALYKDYNLYEEILKQAKDQHPKGHSPRMRWPDLPKRGKIDWQQVLKSKNSFS